MSKTRRENVSLRPSELVIAAIHNLEGRKGSSSGEIVDFIARKYDLRTEQVKSHVEKALKRGVYFGVLAESDGLYQLLDVGNVRAGNGENGKRTTGGQASGHKRRKVSARRPQGKDPKKSETKSKRKSSGSGKQKRKASGKTRGGNDVAKKCCVMKMVRGRKQKLAKALQQKKLQQARKKVKQRVT